MKSGVLESTNSDTKKRDATRAELSDDKTVAPPTKKVRDDRIYLAVYIEVDDGHIDTTYNAFNTREQAESFVTDEKVSTITEWLEEGELFDIYEEFFVDRDDDNEDQPIIDEKKVRDNIESLWEEYIEADPSKVIQWEAESVPISDE